MVTVCRTMLSHCRSGEDNKFWEKDFKRKKREENGNLNFKFKTKLLKSDLAKENQENDPRCIFLQQRIKF